MKPITSYAIVWNFGYKIVGITSKNRTYYYGRDPHTDSVTHGLMRAIKCEFATEQEARNLLTGLRDINEIYDKKNREARAKIEAERDAAIKKLMKGLAYV